MDIDSVVARCGILVGLDRAGKFTHAGTAWAVGRGEWITAWTIDEAPGPEIRLMSARDGTVGEIRDWEQNAGIAGFVSLDVGATLAPARDVDAVLKKRARLWALGFPSVIDHPAFRLHRGSLTAERYYPYLCPWTVSGHLALFTADDGYLAGRCYPGMEGGPVLNERDEVVGLLLGGDGGFDHPPLARFRRVD